MHDILDFPKLGSLFLEFYQENIGVLPGYEQGQYGSINDKIRIGAYDFLNDYCGNFTQGLQITNNKNLDDDLYNIFAQTFVRHFYNTMIGFTDTDTFKVSLSGFLAEQLPLWAQFFNEAIIKRGGFITNAGQVFVDNNGNLNYQGTNKGTNQSTAKTNGTANSTTSQTSNSTGQVDGTSSSTSQGKATADNTTTGTQQNQNLKMNTTSPQDRINFNGDNIKAGDLTGVYDFSYADSINGDYSNTTSNTSENDTSTSNNQTNGTNSQKSQNQSTGKTTTQNTNNSTNDTTSNVNNEEQHQQHNDSTSNTTTQQRNQDVFSLALQMNRLSNGVYLDIFKKAKQEGLFLLTY